MGDHLGAQPSGEFGGRSGVVLVVVGEHDGAQGGGVGAVGADRLLDGVGVSGGAGVDQGERAVLVAPEVDGAEVQCDDGQFGADPGDLHGTDPAPGDGRSTGCSPLA